MQFFQIADDELVTLERMNVLMVAAFEHRRLTEVAINRTRRSDETLISFLSLLSPEWSFGKLFKIACSHFLAMTCQEMNPLWHKVYICNGEVVEDLLKQTKGPQTNKMGLV